MKEDYKDVYGTWEVTTEGDCEGRTTRNLGTHTGYVDVIALYLANQCNYTLKFKKVEPIPESDYEPTRKEISINYSYESEVKMSDADDFAEIRRSFRDRPVNITLGQYYNSFKIILDDDEARVNRTLEQIEHEENGRLNFGFGM